MNYELIILALIAGLPATITAIAALVLQVANSKKLDANSEKMDGKLTQLVDSKVEAATATATLVEKKAQEVKAAPHKARVTKRSED